MKSAFFTYMYEKNSFYNFDGSNTLNNNILQRQKKLTPEEEADFHCSTGIDKDGMKVKYISDFKGKYTRSMYTVSLEWKA